MKSFKNAGLNRVQRLMVIGKAHFEFHSRSYVAKNSCSPMSLMLWTQIVFVFLNDFNVQKQIKPEFSKDYLNEKLNVRLTDKEFEIVQDIIEGITNPQMASKYFVSENTIKSHIKNIYVKLNAHSKAEMTRIVLAR